MTAEHCCESRSAALRMVAALGGWERATRRLVRRQTAGGDQVLACVLCAAMSAPIQPGTPDSPHLVPHDGECFISIARMILGVPA